MPQLVPDDVGNAQGASRKPRGDRSRPQPERPWDWLVQPRSLVFAVLAVALGLGAGRKLLKAWHARRAVNRLNQPDITAEEIEAAAAHGRAALPTLFALLEPKNSAELRQAAGRALLVLWAKDELVAEEEKAIVSLGFECSWRARRTYPRQLHGPIPIEARIGLPYVDPPDADAPQLEWSARIVGSRRASHESFQVCAQSNRACLFGFEIWPDDFPERSPHRISLEARVCANGPTSQWQMVLPQVVFSFEFDPNLTPEALMTMPDSERETIIGASVSLGEPEHGVRRENYFLPLTADFALRGQPVLRIDPSRLPCDLAHRVFLEFEAIEGRYAAGGLIALTSGELRFFPRAEKDPWYGTASKDQPLKGTLAGFPILDIEPLPDASITSAGEIRLRAALVPDCHLGWSHPGVRSIWPGELSTPWITWPLTRR